MSQDNSLERIKFASDLIGNLVEAGLSLGEVAATLESSANMLDGLKEAGYSYDKVAELLDSDSEEAQAELKTALEKTSFLEGMGAKAMGMLGAGAALGLGGGLYGANSLGKLIGKSMAQATEKGPDYLEEVKHQELLDVLRDNAATLRRRKALQDAQEGS